MRGCQHGEFITAKTGSVSHHVNIFCKSGTLVELSSRILDAATNEVAVVVCTLSPADFATTWGPTHYAKLFWSFLWVDSKNYTNQVHAFSKERPCYILPLIHVVYVLV